MTAANTRDCLTTFIGVKAIGALFDAFPTTDRKLAAGTKTLVFEDGRGLTIAANGSFWVESSEEVERAVRVRQQELRRVREEIEQVLDLAGRQPSDGDR